MIVLEWEREYNSFIKHNNWYEVSSNKELLSYYLRFIVSKKFNCNVELSEDNPNNNQPNKDKWVYAGCTFNELGEVKHIIKNTVTNQEVKFNLNQVGFYINIENSEFNIKKVNKFVNKVIDDLKFKVFIRQTGRTEAYQKKAYVDIYDMFDVLKGNLEEAFQEYSTLLSKCLSGDFPFPEALENKVDTVRIRYYLPMKNDTRINNTLDELSEGKGIDSKGLNSLIKNKGKIYYVKLAKLYVMEKLNQKEITQKEQSKCDFVIKQANRLIDIADTIRVKELNYIINNGVIPVLKKGNRLATQNERDKLYYGTEVEYKNIITVEEQSRLSCLSWALNGDEKRYLKVNSVSDKELGYILSEYDDNNTKIENMTRKLYYSLNWIGTVDLTSLKNTIEKYHIRYLEVAEDEIQPDELKIEDMVKEIYAYKGDKKKMLPMDRAVKLIDKVTIDALHNDLRLAKYIFEAFNLIHNTSIFNSQLSVVDKAIVIDKKAKMLPKEYTFHLKIVSYIVKYGKASEKQARFVDEAYDYLATKDKALGVKANKVSQGIIDKPVAETPEQLATVGLNDMYSMFSG